MYIYSAADFKKDDLTDGEPRGILTRLFGAGRKIGPIQQNACQKDNSIHQP